MNRNTHNFLENLGTALVVVAALVILAYCIARVA